MRKNSGRIIMLATIFAVACLFNSCKKDQMAEGTDKILYDMALATEGFTWFGNSGSLLDRSSASGHSQPFLRTRYNSVAARNLDPDGKVKPGSVFAEGSLIVKELYDNSTTLGQYAILYKQSFDNNADSKGWVWGYLGANGTVAEPSSEKGTSCISCHSQSGNIDYTLMNKFFQ